MKKIGLALGGGGARGFAHIGILKAFEAAKIPVCCISGTSMGAIIGGAYAADPDARRLENNVRELLASEVFSVMRFDLFKKSGKEHEPGIISKTKNLILNSYIHIVEETKVSLIGLGKLEEAVNFIVPDIDIAETKIRFSCTATDLSKGVGKLFEKGSLRRAVLASASIPGIFPPVLINGSYYCDGGQVNNTPVAAVKAMGADFAVACEVKSDLKHYESFQKARDVLFRANNVTNVMLHELQLKDADMVISPPIKHLHWTDFDKIDAIISGSEKEAQLKLSQLKKHTGKPDFIQKILRFFNRIK